MEKIISKMVLWNWRILATQTVVGFGLVALFWRKIPPEVPLFYSRPWGQDQLVAPYWLWSLPLVGLVIGIITGLGGRRLAGQGVLRAVLVTSGIILQIIIVLALIRIIILVT